MSWISALMKTNPINKEVKELAKQMAHSKNEQSRYDKDLRNLYYILIFFIYLLQKIIISSLIIIIIAIIT
jgi:hypothetical protein